MKLLYLILPLLLLGIASATTTSFTQNGLPSNAVWNVTIYNYTNNTNFNVNFFGNTVQLSTSNSLIHINTLYFFRAYYSSMTVIGEVVVGGNNQVNFNTIISNGIITVQPYVYCLPQGCVSFLGSVPKNASILQNQVLSTPYSGSLIIYLNPQGYFEYIINSTGNQGGKITSSMWVDLPPDQLVLPPLNLTLLSQINGGTYNASTLRQLGYSPKNSSVKNATIQGTYIGSIFYSQLIDITPIEYDMLIANITPRNFFTWIEQNPTSFYNTTVVYQINTLSAKITGYLQIITSAITSALLTAISPGLGMLSLFGNQGLIATATRTSVCLGCQEASVPVLQSVPLAFSNMQNSTINYPLQVSYAYPSLCSWGSLANGGVCIQKGVDGMTNFNNYVDGGYAPQVAMSQFETQSIPTIFVILILVFLFRTLNGE